MSEENERFSIDLGPELDPPGTDEWAWVEDGYKDEQKGPKFGERADRTHLGREERRARQRKGPKSIPSRALPPLSEVTMESEPSVLDDSLRDLELGDIQTVAEEMVRKQTKDLGL